MTLAVERDVKQQINLNLQELMTPPNSLGVYDILPIHHFYLCSLSKTPLQTKIYLISDPEHLNKH